jgi:hypothetical protein
MGSATTAGVGSTAAGWSVGTPAATTAAVGAASAGAMGSATTAAGWAVGFATTGAVGVAARDSRDRHKCGPVVAATRRSGVDTFIVLAVPEKSATAARLFELGAQ